MSVENFIQKLSDQYKPNPVGPIVIPQSELFAELTIFMALTWIFPRSPELVRANLYQWYFLGFDRTISPYYTEERSASGAATERQLGNAVHALSSEVAELLWEPSVEELGDCFWYYALLLKLLDKDEMHFEQVLLSTLAEAARVNVRQSNGLQINSVVAAAGRIASYIKKTTEKHKPLDRDQLLLLVDAVGAELVRACFFLDVSPGTVLERNLAKLVNRHPDGFNPEYRSEGEVL